MARVAVKLVLIFLLLYAGVYLWYERLEKKLLADIPEPAKIQKEKPVAGNRQLPGVAEPAGGKQNFQIIVSRNIFQAALKASVKPVVKEVEKVVPTSLNLTLLGTVTGNDRDARAIIVDKNGKQQDLYQIGDALQGAFIESIERGKVTLSVNGKKESLLIKDREGGGAGPPKSSPAAFRAPSNTAVGTSTTRQIPRVRPHRRISFRQDPVEPEAEPEIVPVEEDEAPEVNAESNPVEEMVPDDVQEEAQPVDDPGDGEPAVIE